MNARDLLAPLALGYASGVRLRNLVYDLRLLKSARTDTTVVSVGNIQVGGTGKTPVTISLARTARSLFPGLGLAVVSRGYGRSSRGVLAVSDGEQILLDSDRAGDEPLLIARSLPGVPVVVAERRVEGVRFAEERFGTKLVFLDDGFQHRALARDLDIVLLDTSSPAWSWRPLPVGRLRETMSGLKRADLVVFTGGGSRRRSRGMRDQLAGIREVTPIAEGRLEPTSLRPLDGSLPWPLQRMRGLKAAGMCGIARPERFFKELEKLGVVVVLRKSLPDHGRPSRRKLEQWAHKAASRGAEVLIITAKDAVKWTMNSGLSLPVLSLETAWRWTSGEEEIDLLLRRVVEARQA